MKTLHADLRLHGNFNNVCTLSPAHKRFFDGLKRNSSIHDVRLLCNSYDLVAGRVGNEILNVYQENNNSLARLKICHASLHNDGDIAVATTLTCCTNLQHIELQCCNITDEQLLPLVEIIRGHASLRYLDLRINRIGNVGCAAFGTLLESNCNLRILALSNNDIDNEGAIAIANSLTNNTNLQGLCLDGNPIDEIVHDVFSKLLCNNTMGIDSIYSSNHTFRQLLTSHSMGRRLDCLQQVNRSRNKRNVAIVKILRSVPHINMGPLFEWGGMEEEEGEHTLKALPYVVGWFERAEDAAKTCSTFEWNKQLHVAEKKLSSILQFVIAMPLLFEGIATMEIDNP